MLVDDSRHNRVHTQARYGEKQLTCPAHVCHTCASDNPKEPFMKYNKVPSIYDIQCIFDSLPLLMIQDNFITPFEQNLIYIVFQEKSKSDIFTSLMWKSYINAPLAAAALHPLPHGIPLWGLLRHGGHRADHVLSDHMPQGERNAL